MIKSRVRFFSVPVTLFAFAFYADVTFAQEEIIFQEQVHQYCDMLHPHPTGGDNRRTNSQYASLDYLRCKLDIFAAWNAVRKWLHEPGRIIDDGTELMVQVDKALETEAEWAVIFRGCSTVHGTMARTPELWECIEHFGTLEQEE